MAAIATRGDVDPGRLREVRAGLLAQRRLRGRRFSEEYCAAVDEWLDELFTGALRRTVRGPDRVALIAVGGYGRRELSPGSDLDLLLVHDGVKDVGAIADALWYPIWDAGLQMDHSVRTPRETIGVVRSELKSALGLLDGRHIAGDRDLAARVLFEANGEWASRPRVSLDRLRASLHERWDQHGELAFLLEPDVKLARGGLRDFQALGAAAIAAPGAAALLDDPSLAEAGDELLTVRVALHATTGRRSDRLLLDHQDAVARRLGFADAEELLPRVAAAARRIAWASDQLWSRIDVWLAGPRRRVVERTLGPGIALRDDELAFDDGADPATDPSLALRLAAASARSGVSIAPDTLTRLEAHAAPPAEPWPPAVRGALVDLLGCGHAAVPLLETLDHLGVLGRYIREWQAVRSKPQRSAYHRYTVDRHLFEAAAEAAELSRDVHRPDLLLVAAWLHDIGKGFPGDHTEAGERLIRDIAGRMGFEPEDVETLVRLVRDHLLLADTATRRDLSDPATIEMVADRVGGLDRLELLAALTHADAVATGPGAWTGWKATLVDELVVKTRALLRGDAAEPAEMVPTIGQRTLMSHGDVRIDVDGSALTVVAPDRQGLLAIVAGVLAVSGLPVRAATGITEGTMAVEVFDLDLTGRGPPDAARLATELETSLADPDALRIRLLERARGGGLPRRPGAAHTASPRVLFENALTPRATIVEVRAPDGEGLLSRIAHAIALCRCDISVVRALTLGHEIVDTFYVTDGATGAKVTDPEFLGRLEVEILDAVRIV